MKIHKFPNWVIISVFIIELFLLICLFLVNYNAALALLLGIILGLLLVFFPILKARYEFIKPKVIREYKCWSKSKKAKILIISLSSLIITLLLFKNSNNLNPRLYSTVIAEHYEISFEPLNKELTKFRTQEELQITKKEVQLSIKKNPFPQNDLPPNSFKEYYSDNQTSKFRYIRNINSINRGLAVKELYIVPLNLSLEGYINLNLNNGSTMKIQVGGSRISNIIIDKIPKGSFYQAKDADNFKLFPYLNEETVRWSVSNLEQGIRFAYIVEPFNYLNWALRPLLKISSIPGVIFTFFGAIITFIFSLRFKPIVNVKAIAKAEGILMAENSKYDMRGANFQGGFAETNYGKMIENQHNYNTQSNLVEAAAQIQQLLKQLEATYPTTTEIEKLAIVAKASEEIKKNSTLKAQVINALKAGGTEAFKEAVDHPLVNILVATVEGWQEAK